MILPGTWQVSRVALNATAQQAFSAAFHSNSSALPAHTSVALGSFVELVVEFPWWEFPAERMSVSPTLVLRLGGRESERSLKPKWALRVRAET